MSSPLHPDPVTEPRRRSVAQVAATLVFLLSIVYFNALFTYSSRAPTPWVRLEPRISIEVLTAIGLIALWGAAGRRIHWPVKAVLAVVTFVAALVRYVDVSAPAVMGREFNSHADLPHVLRVAGMFWEAVPTLTSLAVASALVLTCVVFIGLNWAGLSVIERALQDDRARQGVLVVVLGSIGLFTLGSLADRAATTVFAEPVGAIVARQWRHLQEGRHLRTSDLPTVSRSAGRADSDLGRLAGAHVYMIFLESFGVTLIEDEQHYPYIAPRFRRFEERLRTAGFSFVSNQAVSPTFAGGSWRAHATVLSGIRLANEHFYNALLASDRKTLVHLLADAGYRTVAAEPGIQREWPEAAYFDFDAIYDAAALDYRGKPIGWWKIPDQYTLYRMYTDEIAPALDAGGPPLFAKIALIMSHIPYFPIPPFVDDWSRFDDQTAFDRGLPSIAADDYRDLSQLSSRYVASFEYEIDIIEDFVVRFVPDNALVIVAGDHQPPKLVTHDNDSWAVPILLISRRADLVEPFRRYGFRAGLVPLHEGTFAMEDFLPAFLEAFHAGDGTNVAAAR